MILVLGIWKSFSVKQNDFSHQDLLCILIDVLYGSLEEQLKKLKPVYLSDACKINVENNFRMNVLYLLIPREILFIIHISLLITWLV